MCSLWMMGILCVGLRPSSALSIPTSLLPFPLFISFLNHVNKTFEFVSQVILLQSYIDHSTTTIEAMYVFPLNDDAAV